MYHQLLYAIFRREKVLARAVLLRAWYIMQLSLKESSGVTAPETRSDFIGRRAEFRSSSGQSTLIELANSATSLLPATHLVLWPLSSEKTSHTDTLPLDFQDIRIAINTNWHPSDVRCLASARILTLKLPMLIITMHGYRISVSRADLPRNTIRVDLREQRRG